MNVPFCFILVLFGGMAVAPSALDKKSSQLENGGKDILVGDTKYTPEQLKNRFGKDTMRSRRAAFAAGGNIPWKTGYLFYEFKELNPAISARSVITDSRKGPDVQEIKNYVLKAMAAWEEHTCIKFVENAERTPRIIITTNSKECSASKGKDRDPLALNLNENCIYHKSILHELGHAIGLMDEQNRPDRNKYLTINFNNIKAGYEKKFEQNSPTEGTSYDPYSIMHEDYFTYSKSLLKPVFTTIKRTMQYKTGRAQSLSFKDIKAINIKFNCKGLASNCKREHSDCPDGGYVDKNCKCICPVNGSPTAIQDCP